MENNTLAMRRRSYINRRKNAQHFKTDSTNMIEPQQSLRHHAPTPTQDRDLRSICRRLDDIEKRRRNSPSITQQLIDNMQNIEMESSLEIQNKSKTPHQKIKNDSNSHVMDHDRVSLVEMIDKISSNIQYPRKRKAKDLKDLQQTMVNLLETKEMLIQLLQDTQDAAADMAQSEALLEPLRNQVEAFVKFQENFKASVKIMERVHAVSGGAGVGK